MLHRKKLARDLFLHFDWIGVLLYTEGLAIFIFRLNWGGVLYAIHNSLLQFRFLTNTLDILELFTSHRHNGSGRCHTVRHSSCLRDHDL